MHRPTCTAPCHVARPQLERPTSLPTGAHLAPCATCEEASKQSRRSARAHKFWDTSSHGVLQVTTVFPVRACSYIRQQSALDQDNCYKKPGPLSQTGPPIPAPASEPWPPCARRAACVHVAASFQQLDRRGWTSKSQHQRRRRTTGASLDDKLSSSCSPSVLTSRPRLLAARGAVITSAVYWENPSVGAGGLRCTRRDGSCLAGLQACACPAQGKLLVAPTQLPERPNPAAFRACLC